MPITRISVDNPVFATMMMVALMVLGLFSYNRLGVDQFPDVDFPIVVVSTQYPGASPETVETDVTRPVEDAVNTIAGIKTLTSRSYESQSVVIAEFDLKTASVQALQDVREKVSAIRAALQDDVKDPQITRFNPDDQPILSLAVKSDIRPLRDLTTLTDQIILKRLQNVRGVGKATIAGGVKRQIQVRLKPQKLEALTIGVDEVIRAVSNENKDMPAGTVSGNGAERVVQVDGRVREPRELLDLIVARRGAAPVRLGQVAEVIDGHVEQESLALFNGAPALAVDIVKVQGANTVEVARGLYKAIDELKQAGALPADVGIDIVRDSSRGITNSLNNVQKTLVEGGILTVLIVMVFLGSWRSTVITALTLPVAVLGTFGVLAAFGFTLNTMTLMALSLAIGILIDDAIVVRENIMRHLGKGQGHRQAALDGTAEIGLAVLATTLTIVAVFLPVAFMGGIIGRFFLQFGITVSAAVLISLFVSFTLDPMLSSVWYDPAAHGRHGRGPFAASPVGSSAASTPCRTAMAVCWAGACATAGWCCWPRWRSSSAASCWCPASASNSFPPPIWASRSSRSRRRSAPHWTPRRRRSGRWSARSGSFPRSPTPTPRSTPACRSDATGAASTSVTSRSTSANARPPRWRRCCANGCRRSPASPSASPFPVSAACRSRFRCRSRVATWANSTASPSGSAPPWPAYRASSMSTAA